MGKENKICPVCGNIFSDYISNQRKFCSTKCSHEGRIKNGNCGEKWYTSMKHVDMGKWKDKKNEKLSNTLMGRIPWNKGLTKENNELVKKYVDKKIGKNHSEETIDKISKSKKGIKPSEETKIKMSKSARLNNKIQKKYKMWHPNYNPKACILIEEYGKINGYDFQHALNGGEYYINELGYWVDGYDKEKNVVIEYYESFHKKQRVKDEQRKQEIIEFLNCEFIILWE